MNKLFNKPVNVYLAAPFFSQTQINKVELLENALSKNKTVANFFSPMRCQHPEFLPKEVEAIKNTDYRLKRGLYRGNKR